MNRNKNENKSIFVICLKSVMIKDIAFFYEEKVNYGLKWINKEIIFKKKRTSLL